MARGERFRIRSELREERWARGRIEQVGSQRETVASDAQTRSTVRRITTLEFIINASSAVLKKTNESTKNAFVRSFVRLCALWDNRRKEIWHRRKDNYRTKSCFFSFLLLRKPCIRTEGERERKRDSKKEEKRMKDVNNTFENR